MKNAGLLFLLTLTLGISSCEEEYSGDPLIVTYDTVPFERIELETSSHIRIIQANYYQVVVDGRENDVYDTEVIVSGNVLIIQEHGNIDPGQVISIFVPEIQQLDSYGSSEIYGESQFRQNGNMAIRSFGSGEIDMYVDTDNLDILISGSGNIYLEGLADNVDLDLTGSGWAKTFILSSDFSDVYISGSGSAEVTVDNDLDVNISGSGDVYYKGHPQINSTISGSGKVINAN
jgi:hypothetical protein